MSNDISNYPFASVDRQLTGSEQTGLMIRNLRQLGNCGKPETDAELIDRIDGYFDFCEKNNLRPGIEGLALSLGVTRQTFWHWCKGHGSKSDVWIEECQRARATITAFYEQIFSKGMISPPSGIFILKNVAGWKDVISFEEQSRDTADSEEPLSIEELPNLKELGITEDE